MIPFFDKDEAGEADWRGGNVLSYCREDLPDTPPAQEVMAAVLREEAFLCGSQRKKEPSHCQYIRRSTLNNRLRDLHRIMGHWRSYPPRWERTW